MSHPPALLGSPSPDAPETVAHQTLSAWAAEARLALAGNTLRAYASDSAAFADWCALRGHPSFPATPAIVVAYIKSDAETKSTATVRRRVSTIGRLHRAAGISNPCESELVKLALRGVARAKGTDQRQATGISSHDAVTIQARTGDSIKDCRDIALMLVGRDLLARSSELVAIRVEDIDWLEDGALVSLRRSKTSTDTQSYFIGAAAASALRGWLDRAGIDAGLVFRSLSRAGRPKENSLDTRDVRRLLKGLARMGGIPDDAVSGHSLRVGMAQDLVAANLDIASVMQAGGWRSPTMVARYTEKLTAQRGAVARFYRS